jgi:hypothetical protein
MQAKPALILTSDLEQTEHEYLKFVMETAELLDTQVVLTENGDKSTDGNGSSRRLEIYQHASSLFTMGNTQAALSEAIDTFDHQLPLITQAGNPAMHDLLQLGFWLIETKEYPTLESVAAIELTLAREDKIEDLVAQNRALAEQYYSLERLEHDLYLLLSTTLTT